MGQMSSAAVVHTSARLNGQMDDAMPTAMPVFALTSTEGNAAGSSVGSFIVLS